MSTEQKNICKKYDAAYEQCDIDLKIAVKQEVIDICDLPVHGFRLQHQGISSGWFLWTGEYSNEKGFFRMINISQLNKWCPHLSKYLALPAGWRILVNNDGYEDVWLDQSLKQPL